MEDGATAGTGKALPARGADQGSLAAGHASTRLKVLVVLMETVDVVRVLFGAESRAIPPDALAPGGLVQHQEDQAMQEQGVEERNSPGHLVGEDHTTEAQSCFIPGA